MNKPDSTTCTFTASKYRQTEMAQFLQALRNMGLELDYHFSSSGRTVEVTVRNVPDQKMATIKRTRGAGRKANRLNPPTGSPFTAETPCEDFLKWRSQKGVTVDQAAQALGISRATYYRQKVEQQMKVKIAEYDEMNRRRKAKGMPALTAKLGQIELGSNNYHKE